MAVCPKCNSPAPQGAKLCGQCGSALPQLSPGQVLRSYKIVKYLKSGGMGSVYLATTDFGGRFIVKELLDLHTNPRDRQEAVAAFEREAMVLRVLNHPAIPRVVDHFDNQGRWYLVMDQVDGEDLEERLTKTRSGSIPEAVVRDWAVQLCSVLEYLHGHQPPVIFRDLKPANIMVTAKNVVTLVDFGIAKVFAPKAKGTQIGTPGYAAPEQYHGLSSPCSDVYALGATLYHLLSGHGPDQFSPNHMFDGFDWTRVSGPWVPVLKRATALREQDRFRDIGEFKRAIPGPAAPSVSASAPAPVSTLLPSAVVAAPAFVTGPQTKPLAGGLANPFLPVPGSSVVVAQFPVTNEQYREFVRATNHRPPEHWVSGRIPPGLEYHPVVWVSQSDARQYAVWAGARLLTEAEWLQAANTAAGQPWPWGFNYEARGNFDQRQTTPVNWYPDGASPSGHQDLAGNVWEWTATSLPDGTTVVKGGSYYGPRPITDRGTYQPDTRNAVIGFRVCR